MMNRNVRCVLAYMNARADRLHRLAWEGGKTIPEHIRTNISLAEAQYYQRYKENIEKYN